MLAKENRNLNIFLITQIIASFAYNFALTALSYQILQISGSAAKFAMSIVLNNLPKIFLLQIAGLLADQFDKRKLFIFTDVFYSLSLGLSVMLCIFYNADVKVLLITSFVLGLLRAFSTPITKSIAPILAPRDKLLKANSYEISNDKIARTIGPVISMFILSIFGFTLPMIIASFIYAAMAISKSFIVIDHVSERKFKFSPFEVFSQIYRGAISLFNNRGIVLLLLNALTTQLLFHPFNYVVLPTIFRKLKDDTSLPSIQFFLKLMDLLHLSEKNVWLSLLAFVGLGGAVGTLLSLYFLSRLENKITDRQGITVAVGGKLIFGSMIIAVVSYFGYLGNGLSLSALVILLFIINVGLFFSFNLFTIYFAHYYQKEVPREELGKFIANFMVFFNLSSSLGSLMYGFSSENNLHIPLILLAVGVLLKVVLHIFFISSQEKR